MSAGGREGLTHWEGEPVTLLEALLEVPRVEAWGELSSTNDRARTLAVAGAPGWTVVLAEEQTRGRGRSGSRWESPAGVGLWVSILLRAPGVARDGLVSILAGLALARAVEAEAGLPAGLKWPNDLWVDGRKAAGILCETEGDAVAVGIGVNVRQGVEALSAELRSRAGSLESAGGRRVSRLGLLRSVVRELRRFVDPPPAGLDDELLNEWRRRDVLLGRRVRVAGIVGRAAGLDPRGYLVLDTDGGESRPVAGGHVEIIERRPPGPAGE